MKLKKFLKPNILKIILSIIILWFIAGYSYGKLCSCMFEPWVCGPIYCSNGFALISLFIVPAYLLSCLITIIILKIYNIGKKK